MSRPNFQRISVAILFLLASLPVFSDSQVRIVRLSYIDGSVQSARDSEQGYEKALLNLPISQGAKLRTMDGGRAEVEFEDGSTIRLAPNSAVEFPQLSLRDSGSKVSAVEMKQGTVYVDFANAKNEEFTVLFGHEKLMLTHSAHLRIGVDDEDATVAVFKGDIQIEGASGTVNVAKNQTAEFDLSDNDLHTLAKSIQQEPYDDWNKQQDQYHLRYASNSYTSYSPYAYGASDLGYYGNFFNAPGYGMMWQPYFAGMGWDPFMDGAWAFSPGWGFGWVSAYPWGWTPYHYGTWVFLPGYGWAWQPGGAWTTWYAQPRILNPPKGFALPQAPATGTKTVTVNHGPAPTLANQSGSKLVIRSNSAGLGVPRGEITDLARISQLAQQRGKVSIHTTPVSQTPSWGRGDGISRGSASRGAEPSSRGNSASEPATTHTAPPPSSLGRAHK